EYAGMRGPPRSAGVYPVDTEDEGRQRPTRRGRAPRPGVSDDRAPDAGTRNNLALLIRVCSFAHFVAPQLHVRPVLAPRVTRSSSSCPNVSPIASAAPVPAASRASFEG